MQALSICLEASSAVDFQFCKFFFLTRKKKKRSGGDKACCLVFSIGLPIRICRSRGSEWGMFRGEMQCRGEMQELNLVYFCWLVVELHLKQHFTCLFAACSTSLHDPSSCATSDVDVRHGF